ncbi:MAG TPA: c-type cytochrome [Gammaproteobacteria bacterium]
MGTKEELFFEGFLLLLGVWIGTIVGIVIFADIVGDGTLSGAEEMSMIEERIRPIGQVALIGDPDVGVMAAVAVAPAAVTAPLTGPQVYNEICQLCHTAPGVGGAPVLGDAAAWAPRLEQTADVLQDRVINGYTGEAGFMPPKGGRLDLSDDEILGALDYMLEAVR